MTITADTLVPEQLWQAIQPLLHHHAAAAAGPASTTAPPWPATYQLRTGISWTAAAHPAAGLR
jgi:hypothetical protein